MTNQIISQILIYLTDFSKFAKKLAGGIDTSGLRYDWLIIFFFVFVILLMALSLGRSRMLLALLSLYVAVFLESHFIFFDKIRMLIKNKPDYLLHLGLFFIIYFLVFAILSRSVLKQRLTLSESSIFAVALIAVLEMGFLAAILFSYFPDEWLNKVPARLMPYFATENARFWWALVSLFALLLSKNKKSRPAAIL